MFRSFCKCCRYHGSHPIKVKNKYTTLSHDHYSNIFNKICHLQNDLDKLVKWSEKWQMLLNFWKCKCLHTGHGNLDINYNMGDTVLGTTVKEKDLGITISADMKVSEQCGIAAS